MPQDPNLYGQRPAKKQKKEIPLSSSLAFTSQLTSLLSAEPSSSSAASGRARPSKTKDDIFSSVRTKKRDAPTTSDGKSASGKRDRGDEDGVKLVLKDPRGTEEDKQDLVRTRRRMEEKARLYAAMKRGDYVAREGEAAPLVDFDSKWAASHPEGHHDNDNSSSGGTDYSDDNGGADNELIEYKDEFGRTRQGTRAQVARQRRREARAALGAEELEAMSARPRAPEALIRGDAVQTAAWRPDDDAWDRMEALAARRDREPTPPEDTHYDGAREIRTKGVGFYQFSRDNAERDAAMESLHAERAETERARGEREAARERRKREIEERRRKIGEKRSKRLADEFLKGLGAELMGAGGTGAAPAAPAAAAAAAAAAPAAAASTAPNEGEKAAESGTGEKEVGEGKEPETTSL